MNKLVIHLWMLCHKPYCNLVKLPTYKYRKTEREQPLLTVWQTGQIMAVEFFASFQVTNITNQGTYFLLSAPAA